MRNSVCVYGFCVHKTVSASAKRHTIRRIFPIFCGISLIRAFCRTLFRLLRRIYIYNISCKIIPTTIFLPPLFTRFVRGKRNLLTKSGRVKQYLTSLSYLLSKIILSSSTWQRRAAAPGHSLKWQKKYCGVLLRNAFYLITIILTIKNNLVK